MNRFASLPAVTLVLATNLAWAEADSSADLRYCLDMKSHAAIAKCAGEISAGNKGQPFSKEEAGRMLKKEQASAPVSATESSGAPATVRETDSPRPASVPATDSPRPATVHVIDRPSPATVRAIESAVTPAAARDKPSKRALREEAEGTGD